MPSYDISYTYDAVGNRLTKTDNLASETTTSTYDAANQLETSVDPSGTTDYTYDANGNLTTITDPSNNVTSYTWDEENRRTKVELPSPSTEVVNSTYNGDGLRVKREDSSETRKFIWDGATYLSQTDENDVTQVVYTQTPELPNGYGRLISQRRKDGAGWTTDFFHCDVLGSTTHLTDASETILETFDYDAWGNRLSSNILQPAFLYVGEHGYYADWIENSILDYYVRARTYDIVTARWLSEDPIGFSHGTNLYQYVANSPTSLADPSGLILIAIDGTDSGKDVGRLGSWNQDAVLGNGRIASHVWEFYNNYNLRAWYQQGPDRFGGGSGLTFYQAHTFACIEWCKANVHPATLVKDPRQQPGGYDYNPIEIVGHSRGGHIALGVAKRLNDKGCCCWTRVSPLAPGGVPSRSVTFKPVEVRFMGLYDPIDMLPFFTDGADDVKGNVRNAVLIKAGTPALKPDYCRDRRSWHRNEVTSAKWKAPKAATHGALGGYPCFNNITSTLTHPIPRWITPARDVDGAIASDRLVRKIAASVAIGLPIAAVAAYGYARCVRTNNDLLDVLGRCM